MRGLIPQNSSKSLPGNASWRPLAGFLLLLFCMSARAQYHFDNWTTEHGLPQNSVLSITQTREGYLWLATYNGLVRFDGVRFTVFDKNNTPALKTSRFTDLFDYVSGALWIGVEDGGVFRYDNGVFTAFTTAEGLPSNTVLNVQSGPAGSTLISTNNGAVWWRNGRITPYEWGPPISPMKLYLGAAGTHWKTDQQGLHRLTPNGQVTDYAVPADPQYLANSKLLETKTGTLWIAPPRHGVFKLKDGVLTDYTSRFKLKSPASIMKMLEDPDGSVWFATVNSGLIHLANDPAETFVTYTTANGLAGNGLRGLFRDREGILWIGTDGSGLNRMTRQFITGYSETEGLAGNIAHAVLADRAGNVWVATHNGLSRITNGVITNYQYTKTGGGLPLRGLQALYEDQSGRLWLGGFDGLCSFKDGVFSPALRDLNVWAIHQDRQGTLWVGTHFGLVKFQNGAPVYTYTTKDGLPKDTIRSIHEDVAGSLWLGTEGGLVKFQNGPMRVFTTADGLVNNRVWSIHEDAEGVFWLGTFDGGLSRFKDGRFSNYTKANGLYDNGAFQILEDGIGNLWMSCYRGIYRVSKQQLNDFADGYISALTSTAFGKADGMLSSDCNGGRQPAGIKTADGRLWFITLKGVAIVKPDEIPLNQTSPPLLIESASLDRAEADITQGLHINPGQTNLEIAFTALSLIKAEQTRFQYQLLGQDRHWIEADTRRKAYYSYLPPGHYTFKVIAANSDGVWNTAGAQLAITVLPAFYQTWWFRLLALLIVVGSLGLVFKGRLDRAHRAQRSQEEFSRRLLDSQEQERKRIATELHDSLGQNLLVIKNHALMGLNAASETNPLREHLDEISEAASLSLAEVRQISLNLRPYQLERLGLTNTLQTMLRQIANASDIDFNNEVESVDDCFAPADEINVFRIVQEALNNIIKHSEAQAASVHIKPVQGEIHLTITDDGRGFAVEPFNHAEQQRRGLGLTGIAERVRMLGGKLAIQSASGQGTTLTIILYPTIHVRTK